MLLFYWFITTHCFLQSLRPDLCRRNFNDDMVLENTIITEYKNCSFHIYVYIRVYTRKYNVSSERKKERKHNYIFDLTHLEKLLRNAKLFVLERKSYI